MEDQYKKETKNKTKFYRTWWSMKQRCNDSNYRGFYLYGGRGIKVSSEWSSFKNFYNDMFSTYKNELTLDRIDNDKGYSKENCRWATPKEQANNRRSNKLITSFGITLTLAQWAERTGIKYKTIWQRINAYHWSYEKALGGI